MPALGAGDVTYTLQNDRYGKDILAGSGMRKFDVKIAFGDGALTYPSGGVPLTKASLGCPNFLRSVTLFDDNDGSGLLWKYDRENEKLRCYEGDYAQVGDAPLAELDTTDAPPAQVLYGYAEGW